MPILAWSLQSWTRITFNAHFFKTGTHSYRLRTSKVREMCPHSDLIVLT